MVPVLIVPVPFALGYLDTAICWLLSCIGLHKIQSSDSQTNIPTSSAPARTITETLSVLSFREFVEKFSQTERDVICAVCLASFGEDDEVRKLCNCSHIFHRDCLDKWADQYQTTCPLCRCSILPHES